MHEDETGGEALERLLRGFDGAPCQDEDGRRAVQLWRIGRWLRGSGGRRPRSLHVAGEATVIADGRILQIDEFGGVRDLSTTRRDLGTQLTSLSSWGRRR